jgi:putative ABC transport system permease protein
MGKQITVSVSSGDTNAAPFVMTDRDLKYLASLPHVVGVTPNIASPAEVIYGHRTWSTTESGVSSSYLDINSSSMVLDQGTWWSSSDDRSMRRVVVLGATVVKNLFQESEGVNPVGQTVRIGSQLYRVVGTLQAQGVGPGSGGDDGVYVPYTVVYDPLLSTQIKSITLVVDDTKNLDEVSTDIQTILELHHPVAIGQQDGFDITQALAQLQRNSSFLTTLTLVMEVVAGCSLLVGGVGVMNIMLVSLSERTSEIGLRSALGAQPRDIAMQFLLEAVVLSLTGGVIGLITGLSLSYLVISLIHFSFILNWGAIILALVISTAIGVGFGFYPAIRASRLDPIVALRSA